MQKICEAQSQQQDFLSVGTYVALVVPNSIICPADDFIYGYLKMKGLIYNQFGQNICYFCPP